MRGLLTMVVTAAVLACQAASAQVLVSEGTPGCVIVLGEDAIPAERTAAKELQSFVRQMSGAELPIATSAEPDAKRCRVFIGQTSQTQSILPGFNWGSLAHDGILIKRVGSDLILAGDRPRGSLYAVYDYLESLGVRFFAPDETLVPTTSTIALPAIDKTYVPKLQYRETTYERVIRKNPEFCARLHLNGHHHTIPAEYGSNYSIIGFCHTFDQFLPAATYFESHPEWYSEKKGKRVGGRTLGQLCLTNPEMKQEFIKQVLQQIEHNPSAGIISVSQNDGSGPCECARCTAEVNRLGSQTDLILQFVNDVAAEVKKAYPEFLVDTLAYSYTRQAPKSVRPGSNVLVRLCSDGDFSKPLSSPGNEHFMNDLTAWSKIADKLFIWDYTVGFGNLHMPYPNNPVLGPNVRTFVANKAIGLHEQGDLYNHEVSLQPLKAYLLARLMWDPSQDEDQLTRDFLTGYYAAAGPVMYEYVKLIENALAQSHEPLKMFAVQAPYLTGDVMVKALKLFAQAEQAVADNPKLVQRVRQQKMAIQQAWLRSPLKVRNDAMTSAGINEQRMAKEYVKLAKETNNIYISEGVLFPWDEFMALAVGDDDEPSTSPVPARVKGLPATAWREISLGRVRLADADVAKMVDDPDAVTGKAVRLNGASLDWAAQFFLSNSDMRNFTRAEVIVSVKCTGRAAQGRAFELGMHDMAAGGTPGPAALAGNLSEIKDDGYHEYSLGVHDLRDGMYVYVAPPGNARLLGAMYVDRVYLVKAPGGSR